MSCRVVRDSSFLAHPLFAGGEEAGLPEQPDCGAGDEQNHQGFLFQISELTERVRELERELHEIARESLKQGEKLGYERATAEQQEVVVRLSRAIQEISGLRQRIREEAEMEMVALSLAIARRVLHREITIDPDAVLGLLRAALAKVQAREITRVRTHPAHESTLRSVLAEEQGIDIHPDSSLLQGDVLVETVRGTLDASVHGQLLEIERGFADRLR